MSSSIADSANEVTKDHSASSGSEDSQEIQLEKRLLTPLLWSKKVPPIPTQEERKPYPRFTSFFLSRLLFWWLHPLMNVGYKRTLDADDLFYLTDDMKIDTVHKQFKVNLENVLEKNRQKHLKKNPNLTKKELDALPYPKMSLIIALFKTFKYSYTSAIIYKLITDVSQVLSPLISKALINYVEARSLDKSRSLSKGVGYGIGTTLLMALNGILINHFLHNSLTVGAHCKSILTTELLNKSLVASASTKHAFPPGKITSLMSTDLSRIDLAIGFQPFGITFPVPVIIAIALLIHNIGVASLAGIAVFVVSIFIIGGSMGKLLGMRKKVNQYTDERVSLMREILNCMKMIKYYAWEDAYEKQALNIRTKEVNIIFRMQTIRNFLFAYSICLPNFTSMIAFLVLYAISDGKSPGAIFSSLSLFGVLANQVMMLPMALATGADGYVGLNRVREYLQSSNIDEDEVIEHQESSLRESPLEDDVAIKLKNASFEWETFEDSDDDDEETKPKDITSGLSPVQSFSASYKEKGDIPEELESRVAFKGFHDINLSIKKGEFIIITGPIGSGKSSLLTALSGVMIKTAGSLQSASDVLLCGQPWVQNATVKENILFGHPFDQKWYDQTIDACALTDDLKIFPGGDLTEIGERGITLSGGQKARINLARAVYANREITLFDDVLSAVDARVGKDIVDKCFNGILKNKTRVLATHQLSLIEVADRVVFLNGDGSIHVGTVEELLATEEAFVNLMEFSKKSEAKKQQEKEEKRLKAEREGLGIKDDFDEDSEDDDSFVKDPHNDANAGILINEEERARNKIKWSIYLNYLHEGQGVLGIFALPLALIFLMLDIFTSLFTSVWLSFWIEYKFHGRADNFYIGIYVMITIASIICASTEFVILGYISTTAAKYLNIKAMKKVLHTPMSFLDTTPIGRVLNRFTKDTDALDNETGEQIRMFLHPGAYVIGIIILCIIYFPWFALVIPPLLIVIVSLTSYYQAAGREVKRIEAVQRSLVYNNFNEILSGMATIKAYGSEQRFLDKNLYLLNKMNEAYFIVIANQRWISIHLDLVAACLVLIVAMLTVTGKFNISGASAGVVMTQVLNMGGLMSLILRAYTQVENEMNSVERLCHYANNLEQEPPYRISETQPPPEWPSTGEIEFTNVDLRYRENLPLVLKNLNLKIKPMEKIGICGRTGAGKSSIMTALYRISELAGGSITIDGIDISKIGLYDLRSKLAIIPQDPVLFKGTIRKNLDPFDEHTDDVLWDALRRSGLIDNINKAKTEQKSDKEEINKFHLDQTVEDEGANFSLGERQLLALSRALVRNSKILILDEATSSVDYETDSKIQKTIINEFKDCTILCIAHRLKTILTYDRVIVLEQGEVEEFDTPLNLYNNETGIFRMMCEKSDITLKDFTGNASELN